MNLRIKFSAFLMYGLIMLIMGACTSSPPKRLSLLEAKMATAKIVILDEEERPAGGGTGILVNVNKPGTFLLTARHVCLANTQLDSVYNPSLHPAYPGFVVQFALVAVRAEVHKIDSVADLCLLKLFPGSPADNLPKVEVALASPQLGEPVSVIGFPKGFGPVLSFGTFNEDYLGGEHSFALLTIAIHPGNSGSGVLDRHGRLVGVISWGIHALPNIGGMVNHAAVARFLEGDL